MCITPMRVTVRMPLVSMRVAPMRVSVIAMPKYIRMPKLMFSLSISIACLSVPVPRPSLYRPITSRYKQLSLVFLLFCRIAFYRHKTRAVFWYPVQ